MTRALIGVVPLRECAGKPWPAGHGGLFLVAALLLMGCSVRDAPPAARPSPPADTFAPIALDRVLDGFDMPLLVTHDGTQGRLYVVEQGGLVWRVEGGARDVWLDLSGETRAAGEQGLLGLAFDPRDRRAYVSYTDREGDSVLERVANGRRERLLFVDQPYANHNGGHLAFGPDGSLYYGLGDGGSAGDPQGNGQDPDALLGSLLRLDVSGEAGYAVPPDNFRREVWAKGVRNPWRFSFDRATGDLYLADVGQHKLEEVNVLPAGAPAGANFGWNAYEGSERYGMLGTTFSDPIFPVAEYTHDDGCSITGGYVYRGAREPALEGTYYLADYCSGKVWGLREVGGAWTLARLLDTDLRVASFGEDAAGEIYVVDHEGAIHKIRGSAPSSG